MILHNYYSIGSIIATIFVAFLAIFYLQSNRKLKSTRTLGIVFLLLVPFNASVSYSFMMYHWSGAYYIIVSSLSILFAFMYLTKFALIYPDKKLPKYTKSIFILQLIIVIVTMTIYTKFALQSKIKLSSISHCGIFSLPFAHIPIKNFLLWLITAMFFGFYYDMSINTFIFNLLFWFMLVTVIVTIYKGTKLNKNERKSLFIVVGCIILAFMIPTATNLASALNRLDRTTHLLIFVFTTVLGYFMVFILYINTTKEKTSFMDKILGITIATFLLTIQILNYVSILQREKDFKHIFIPKSFSLLHTQKQRKEVKYIVRINKKKNIKDKSNNHISFIYNTNKNEKHNAFLIRQIAYPLKKSSYLRYGLKQHYMSYRKYYPEVNATFEFGLNYIAYRKHINIVAVRITLSVLLVTLLITIVFPLFFKISLTNPTKKPLFAVNKVDSGDLSVQVPVKIPDEIGILSESFNKMVSSIRDANNTLTEYSKQLENLGKVKDEFMSNLSHELKTPLGIIYGYSEFLVDAEKENFEEVVSYGKEIYTQSEKLMDIINNLLLITAIETNIEIHKAEVDIIAVINNVIEKCGNYAAEKNIRTSVETPEEHMVSIDESLFSKVLYNIFKNAYIYNKDNGTVQIDYSYTDSQFTLKVTDSGIGISAKDIQFIFDKFYRVDSSLTYSASGIGLGLFIARRIIFLHNGTIEVSSNEKTGTTFIITCPIL